MSDVRLWTFAKYKIRDILDVDLVSTTYRATAVDDDGLWRLRVFTGDVPADVGATVIAEAVQAVPVRHPHILATHDADWHDDRVYVVSDDIPGANLREVIARNHPLKPRTALAMGWQLAEALDAVHGAGVIHGCINPHTIWVADGRERDAPMTYLTGFGASLMLARQVKNQHKAPATDDLLYVGPEQMRGERATPEADRYALACAVYHLMAGVPPFQRDSVNALFGAHLFSSVQPPTAVRSDLPPAIDSVLARALAKDTRDRYPSAHALMIGVERALRGQPETGAPARSRSRPAGPTWIPTGDVSRSGASDAVAADGDAAAVVDDATDVGSRDAAIAETAPSRDAAIAETAPSRGDPVAIPAVTRRSDGFPAELFRWDGDRDTRATDTASTVEERRAARERRSMRAPGGAAAARMVLPPRPAVTRVTPIPPRPRRGMRQRRGGVALLVAGVLVTAVVGTVAFAVLRGPARDTAAAGDRQRATAGADGQTIAVTPRWATAPGPASVRAVAVADGVVVSGAGRDVTALDPARGAQLWTSRAPAKVTDLAVLGDLLLVRTEIGVTGYDVTTGKVRWQLDDVSIAALVVGRSRIYAARTDAAGITVSAIDPADGGSTTLATVTDGTQPEEGAPIALAFDRSARRKGGQLLYMLTDAALHAFDPEAGTQRWRALVDAEGVLDEPHLRRRPWVGSLNAAGGAAFVVDRKGRVCRYAAESGAQVWNGCGRFPTALQRPPVVHVRDGMVIVVGADAIAAYDFTAGKPQWQRTSDEGLQRPAAAGGAGTVYVVGDDGALRALDHDTGRERWRAEDAGTVTALLADDGGVYAGGADGVVSGWHDTR